MYPGGKKKRQHIPDAPKPTRAATSPGRARSTNGKRKRTQSPAPSSPSPRKGSPDTAILSTPPRHTHAVAHKRTPRTSPHTASPTQIVSPGSIQSPGSTHKRAKRERLKLLRAASNVQDTPIVARVAADQFTNFIRNPLAQR